eukprot:2399642-Prymnesium_polylepis.1
MPTLEDEGVGPFLYALLTIAPTAMGFFTPMIWGALWDRNVKWVLYCAPLGELIGACLIAAGLRV